MLKYNQEPDIRQVIDHLYNMLNYRQIDEFPDYEAKKRFEQLYLLDRLVRMLEQGREYKDLDKNPSFQIAKRLLGRD